MGVLKAIVAACLTAVIGLVQADEGGLYCLARNVYHEGSKNEPIEGLMAVALVTLNRAKGDLAKICDVVYAPKQFSWTGVKPALTVEEGIPWRNAQSIARMAPLVKDFTNGADHFHALVCPSDRMHECQPDWRLRMITLGQWGNHVFYKERKRK